MFTAKEKIKMFSGVDNKQLAITHGMQVHNSEMVDISDEQKTLAYEMSEVKTFTKSNGTVSLNIHVLYDGNGNGVAAFSPENPNVSRAPISKILQSL